MSPNHSFEQFLEENEQKYGYNGCIEEIRENEFPSLKDQIYLDHAGTTLYSISHLNAQFQDLSTNLYGNPHSKSPSSLHTSNRIASIRARILDFFNASPKDYDIVFTANATAAIKLIAECFPWEMDSEFLCLREAHTSLIGAREIVQNIKGTNVRMVTEEDVECMLQSVNNKKSVEVPHSLFAYPAQCNFSGARYPLSWILRARQRLPHHSILLDAASYLTTSPFSLSDVCASPDFIVLSFYKLFGLPTGLGALILKNSSAQLLHKRYFGGGTVAAVAYDEPWRVDRTGSSHERLEDGTVNFLDIISLDHGISEWLRIFGSFTSISSHVQILTKYLYRKMVELKHWNGRPVCVIYVNDEAEVGNRERQGPVLNFNLIRSDGMWVGYGEVDKVAGLAGVHLRTGGFCNPGSTQRWLNLSTEDVKTNLKAGHVCWDDKDLINGRPTGSIRISLGAMSSITDVLKFLDFLSIYFVESTPPPQFLHLDSTSTQRRNGKDNGEIILSQLIIYPIKSCHGYSIPITTSWPITTYGFLYDREWMLVNDATGVALNQKRVPRMSLIRPVIDLKRNLMTINAPFQDSLEISLDNQIIQSSCNNSSVCDDSILTHRYNDPAISAWFTKALGGDIKVHLARHPVGSSVRFVKPHLQNERADPSSPSLLPISLTNESPFLLISSTSVDNLITRIRDRTVIDPALSHEADSVESACFRGNLVLTGEGLSPYAEDRWKSVQIGNQIFAVLGGCRRCHMVCIHQDTGKRMKEPFLTLALERKFKGQVLFGVHMVHVAEMSKRPFEVRTGERIVVVEEESNGFD